MTELTLKPYYVYKLIDPRDNQVFYVGKGKGNRAYHHEREVKQGRITNYFKTEAIKSIHNSGLKVVVEIVRRFKREARAYWYEAAMKLHGPKRLVSVARRIAPQIKLHEYEDILEQVEWRRLWHS
jgi:hypothetical protein